MKHTIRRLATACGVLLGLLAVPVAADHASAAPNFEVPFPCGQTWSGQTRTDHSPPYAIDFNRYDDYGDPVVASAGGAVSRSQNDGSVGYGSWVEIDHGNGWRTRYAHLSYRYVSVGQRVATGTRLGNVGSTGNSTGPHLHYEQRYNGYNVKARFDGVLAYYWGTKSYKSSNKCGSGTIAAYGTVNTGGYPLNIRSGPSTSYTTIGSLADGTRFGIVCQTYGQSVTGTYGTSSIWDKVYGYNGYVADAYVNTGSDGFVAPRC